MYTAEINSIIENIYQTVYADRPWKEILDRVNEGFHIESSSLIVKNESGSQSPSLDCHTGVSGEFLQFLAFKQSSSDETYLSAINSTIHHPFWLSRFMSEGKKDGHLKAALNSHGFGDSLLINFDVGSHGRGMLVLRSGLKRRDFTAEEAGVATLITPHLRTAFSIWKKLNEAEDMISSVNQALGGFNCGAMRLDENGVVLEINELAVATLSRGDGLEIKQGRLYPRGRETAKALSRALRSDDLTSYSSPVTAVKIERNSGRFYIGVLTCLRTSSQQSREYLLGLRDPFLNLPRESLMNSIFGLTKQEARVAGLLGSGLEVANIASLHLVSVNTVRSQRARIYDKIGINCQSELVKIVNALPEIG